MPRLTQRLIDSLRAEERDRIVFEETLPGFGTMGRRIRTISSTGR